MPLNGGHWQCGVSGKCSVSDELCSGCSFSCSEEQSAVTSAMAITHTLGPLKM